MIYANCGRDCTHCAAKEAKEKAQKIGGTNMKMILAAAIGVVLVILSAAAVAIGTAGRYMYGGRE